MSSIYHLHLHIDLNSLIPYTYLGVVCYNSILFLCVHRYNAITNACRCISVIYNSSNCFTYSVTIDFNVNFSVNPSYPEEMEGAGAQDVEQMQPPEVYNIRAYCLYGNKVI